MASFLSPLNDRDDGYGRTREGRLPATFEVVYGHAWKVPPTKLADGRQVVAFAPKAPR